MTRSRSGRRRPVVGDPNDPRGFERLMAEYLEWLDVHNYSPRTVKTVGAVLGLFAVWCGERGLGQPGEVTPPVLERYQRYLYHYRMKSGRPLSFRTQHQRLVHVQGFFKWLVKRRYLLYNPAAELELPKYSRRLPAQHLSLAEVEEVLAQPDVSTSAGVRDRAILETFYSTGIRRAELIGLDVWDLQVERGWLTIRHGKGDKDRVIPIGARALAWVVKYLETVRPSFVVDPKEPALFLTAYGQRYAPDGLTHQVRRCLEAAGVTKRGACHLFRHTMATLMLEGGADIRYVQEMLGHAKLETTQIYTQVSIQQLKKIHDATHPAKLERTSSQADDPAS